ncbi:MAG TPA: sigma-54 dependent transcriptional regulator [Gammaproteobacteria bacterium]|jgi:transcriptional regulator with GAF, ATPase, and Fis domain|nr:sigma-54 dependent transcriptional regulator [Gammaproteobacteria bacterium]
MATSPTPLLLDLWREVGRHAGLSDSAPELLKLLSPHLPVQALVLVHLLPGSRAAEVMVHEERGAAHADARDPIVFSESDYAALLRWCARREVARFEQPKDWPVPLRALASGNEQREVLAAPLGAVRPPTGMVLFVAAPKKKFAQADVRLAATLLDPLGAAMDNHIRLKEMARLKDAAEADRQSLLTRLGREALEDDIVGLSRGLKPVMQRVAMVAASDASVLILGETGAGKEVVARAIHTRSGRAAGPFIRVNCGAISPELIDSELFGHEKGSFTGAVGQRRGWFERADGGTLFLDEVAELPASAQVRLLRVLQDGRFHRVGGEKEIEVDVRIVAATHRDMAAMVQQHQFREDLWYRIAVFPVILPPLRERRDDIPELAQHFARRASRRLGLPPCEPSAADIALLQDYPWPGNVREMSSVLERAAILGQGERLAVAAALGLDVNPALPTSHGVPVGGVMSLDAAIKEHIQAALARTRGRVSGEHGAAALLKVNANTLRAKMRKLKIEPRGFKRST